MSEKPLTTIYAVRTTIGRERTVQDLIFNKLRTINPVPDLKAILTSEQYRGFIFIEAIHKHDVELISGGVSHVKGKIVGSIPFESIEKVLKPQKVINIMEKGDTVEITSGIFQGSRAEITKMPKEGAKEDISVRLKDSDSPITVKIHGDFLKLIEKGREKVKEYKFKSKKEQPEAQLEAESFSEEELEMGASTGSSMNNVEKEKITEPAKVVITEEEVGTSLDDTFSFTDEIDEEEEEEEEVYDTGEEVEDEDEDEEEDDWAKFM